MESFTVLPVNHRFFENEAKHYTDVDSRNCYKTLVEATNFGKKAFPAGFQVVVLKKITSKHPRIKDNWWVRVADANEKIPKLIKVLYRVSPWEDFDNEKLAIDFAYQKRTEGNPDANRIYIGKFDDGLEKLLY